MTHSTSQRVQVWISAGNLVDGLTETVESVLETGVDSTDTKLLADDEYLNLDARGQKGLRAAVEEVAFRFGLSVISASFDELNENISKTSADYIVFIRNGLMVAEAPARVARFLDENPDIAVVYGDSVTDGGTPVYRPESSPIRLREHDYLGPVVAFRVAAIKEIGLFRELDFQAQILDICLRIIEHMGINGIALLPIFLATAEESYEIPENLANELGQAVMGSLSRQGCVAEIEYLEPDIRRLRYRVTDEPLVSIIIPTRGSSAVISGRDRVLVVEAIRGIVERTTYTNIEFVVVADEVTPDEVIHELRELCGDRLRLVLWDAPFNFSGKMNRGAAAAKGEYLLLLNDDVEIVTNDWLETMLGLAQQPGVGIVGAQLYFEDTTIQHAGQIYFGGVAGHAAFGWNGNRDDELHSLKTNHEVSGVTAACALLSRELFFDVGGFTLELPGNYNDVDLNMKIRELGQSAVVSPWVRLYHFESKTRDPKVREGELETLQARWRRRMQVEMYSRMLIGG